MRCKSRFDEVLRGRFVEMIKLPADKRGLRLGRWIAENIEIPGATERPPPETCLDPHLTYPPDADLRRLLRFEPDSGAIWLGERRMVLLHTAALTALRHDLITSVGKEQARRLLTRMGYACGLHDAGFAAKTRGARALEEMFMVGPQLHMLEGAGPGDAGPAGDGRRRRSFRRRVSLGRFPGRPTRTASNTVWSTSRPAGPCWATPAVTRAPSWAG